MTECKHKWESLNDTPLYRCIRCGAFLRVIR